MHGVKTIDSNQKPEIIAVEEHFMDTSLSQYFGESVTQSGIISDKLFDFFDLRISEMDDSGITKQVLSHQSPGSQKISDDFAIDSCRAVNIALSKIIQQMPNRFDGFAMLPTNLPDAAADELKRSVEIHGLKGAMLHGLNHGEFFDLPKYRPIFQCAQELNVPIYIHPSLPDKTVIERYYSPYNESHQAITRAGWGFGVETGTQAVRLILSGIFDELPDLKIILGHLGESIPFQIARMDEAFSRKGNQPSNFAEVFRRNFWITTSGFFSDSALRCCIEEMGIENILFAIDYPYVSSKDGVDWMNRFELATDLKQKIFSGNARCLLSLN